jgi:hypothetical protein
MMVYPVGVTTKIEKKTSPIDKNLSGMKPLVRNE